MRIRIVADSGCDITQAEAQEKGIRIIPLKTTIGDKEYADGIDITSEQFYEMLIESDVLPRTSQVSPYEYETVFEEELENYDHVICITLSSRLSGCYQSACIAAAEYEGKVTVVDSENVTLGMRNFIDYALMLLKEMDDPEQIKAKLEAIRRKVIVVALMDTLEYLKKGGRISPAAAMAGAVLSIKPVISFKHGEIVVIGKARGSKNGNNLLTECVKAKGEIDYDKPYCLAYSGLSDQLLKKYLRDNIDRYDVNEEDMPIHVIGATIGVHAGPGAIAASFFVK